ncbi:class I SAM-dependent methyltransferase [Candidatus Nitrosarchaeum limnium]|jgi:precorrin-6B methylase 2|uniref:Methyltransferase domain protein n=1 Tax=Candidatus Nitrosarchaeum limnium BG20 TaxID=859192 RepID=S2E819_9ARCH|nr:class I SAM-dependent methyltransferase [Candidatus Nitrosarchaeum limnium]EPA06873.1 methyltransferase domain protein [Candidatus Nitrosarchaeum limnium BG20]
MLNGYWPINYTFEDRYELTGIINYILEYANNSTKKFVIIDVGCSNGSAMKYAQTYLQQKNIESFTIGIDISKNVVDEARKNLDQFINENVLNVDNCAGKADIVICSKAAIFVEGDVRCQIIRKCSEFLKNDGILITDVDCFEKTKLLEWFKLPQYLFPFVPSCFKNGIRGFRKEYRRRIHTRFRKSMKKMYKTDAATYAEKILSAWIDLPYIKKLDWKFQIISTYYLRK